MLSAEVSEIRSILDKSVTYIIPDYQRPFAWKVPQAEEFWDDLRHDPTFLGTFVFNTESQEGKREISVVDGQQRLTVLCILLSACVRHLREINEHSIADITRGKLIYVDDTTGKGKGPKVKVSESIRDVFEKTIANAEWDGKVFDVANRKLQIRKIQPVYEYFYSKLKLLTSAETTTLLQNIYSSTVVLIEIDDIQDAFDIFERTNARGVDLNVADLLKNYLLSSVDQMESTSKSQLMEHWEEIIENANGNVQRLLKYFYVSRKGLTSRRDLFKNIKKYGEGKTELLLQQLSEFSRLYNIMLTSSKDRVLIWADEQSISYLKHEYAAESLNRHYEALRLFGVTPSYPFIIKLKSTITNVQDTKKQEKICKAFLRLLNGIERFHYANYAICQRPGNEIEKFYADLSKQEVDASNFASFVNGVLGEVKKKVVGKDEFIESFCQLSYRSNFELIYYINDRLNNIEMKGGQYIPIYNTDKKLLKHNYNIEHLIAQDASNYELDFSGAEELVQNIGNLIVISVHTNGEIGNKVLAEKLPIIESKETLSEAKMLVKDWAKCTYESMDEIQNLIDARGKKLAERSYDFATNF